MKMLIASLLSIALLAGCSEESGTATDPATAPMAGTDAQSMGMSEADRQAMGMGQNDAAMAGTTATASGTVESMDRATGKIVIAHGPVEALEWPAMTMGFSATPEQIDAVQAGQVVDFEFRSQGADNTITRITPAR